MCDLTSVYWKDDFQVHKAVTIQFTGKAALIIHAK